MKSLFLSYKDRQITCHPQSHLAACNQTHRHQNLEQDKTISPLSLTGGTYGLREKLGHRGISSRLKTGKNASNGHPSSEMSDIER